MRQPDATMGTYIAPVATEGLWRRRMALGCNAGTRAVVAAVTGIVQRHAILSVVLLGCGGCLRRRRVHWISGRLHCDKQRRVMYGEEGGRDGSGQVARSSGGSSDDELGRNNALAFLLAGRRCGGDRAVFPQSRLKLGQPIVRCAEVYTSYTW